MQIQRIINSFFTSNTYIVSDAASNVCWLIDVGDIQPILDHIPAGATIKGVFLTHTHYDHLYGINKLIHLYPDCMVYTSEHGKEGLFSAKLNFSKYHNDPIVFSGSNIRILHEGDKVELVSGAVLTVIETPGHDWSCLSYCMGNAMFTGDSFIPGLKVITTFPHSNRDDAELSKLRILNIADGRDFYPGHGDFFQNFHSELENK
ncbi:MBL fold metallo-hydrolase [Bacteroidia bacterium]|nr:MBL fold metallo-hydrolase [Bacteroidia bacterium]